jgi:hypothetical protein
MTDMDDDDFYEDDEPVSELLAAFDRGQQGFTALPTAMPWSLNQRQVSYATGASVFRTPLTEPAASTYMEPLPR